MISSSKRVKLKIMKLLFKKVCGFGHSVVGHIKKVLVEGTADLGIRQTQVLILALPMNLGTIFFFL